MQRLLRISFNNFVFSLVPIVVWFVIGLIIDSRFVNIFSLTYPMQYICLILVALFSTAPNINETKDRVKGAAFSGFLMGMIIGGAIFLSVILNLDYYLTFLNVEADVYKEYLLFSLAVLYITFVFKMLMERLYFVRREKQANKFMLVFNLIYAVSFIGMALISKDTMQIIVVPLVSLMFYVFYVGLRVAKDYYKKFTFRIYKWFRYESSDIVMNGLMFMIYLFGLSHSIEYGMAYMVALNFTTLITDMQWDSYESIDTVAKIDISKRTFDYKKSLKNSYKLLFILMLTSLAMFFITIKFYEVDMQIFLIYLGLELSYFVVYPIIALKICYLQIKWSPLKTTVNKAIALLIWFVASFMPTPYCLYIGQMIFAAYQIITYGWMYKKAIKSISQKGHLLRYSHSKRQKRSA
ncbi:hypothetical protein IKG07_00420 [Candidatus Saccharibacteria bacterium]|nr:hypothetical protein [Candidatus Saccharibacteria bacterium]